MLRTIALALAAANFASAQDLVAVNWTGSIYRIDTTTGAVLSSSSHFPTLQQCNSSAWTPDGKWWVGADRGHSIVEIDPLTGTIGASVTTTLEIRGLAVHPITGQMYASVNGNELHTIDMATGATTFVAPFGNGSFQSLTFTNDGRLWAWNASSNPFQNGLTELDAATGAVLHHVADPAGTVDTHLFLTALPDGNFLAGQYELVHIDSVTGVETLIGSNYADLRGADLSVSRTLGDGYCGPAVANSTGRGATTSVLGDIRASSNDVWLGCGGLPTNSFGYFLTSETTDFATNPGGSQGNLCLGGAIGRLSNQIVQAGPGGWVAIDFDLTNVPTPTAPTTVTAGTTRSFSYWYRDANPTTTSNFADGRTVTFQ